MNLSIYMIFKIFFRNNFCPARGSERATFYTLTFTINFKHKEDVCYLAYHYPYTYSTLKVQLSACLFTCCLTFFFTSYTQLVTNLHIYCKINRCSTCSDTTDLLLLISMYDVLLAMHYSI